MLKPMPVSAGSIRMLLDDVTGVAVLIQGVNAQVTEKRILECVQACEGIENPKQFVPKTAAMVKQMAAILPMMSQAATLTTKKEAKADAAPPKPAAVAVGQDVAMDDAEVQELVKSLGITPDAPVPSKETTKEEAEAHNIALVEGAAKSAKPAGDTVEITIDTADQLTAKGDATKSLGEALVEKFNKKAKKKKPAEEGAPSPDWLNKLDAAKKPSEPAAITTTSEGVAAVEGSAAVTEMAEAKEEGG